MQDEADVPRKRGLRTQDTGSIGSLFFELPVSWWQRVNGGTKTSADRHAGLGFR